MAHEPVRASGRESAGGRPHAEPSPEAEQARKAQERRDGHEHEAGGGPRRLAGDPAEIDQLTVRIPIRDDDGGSDCERPILLGRLTPEQSDAENEEILQDVDPVRDREGRRENEQQRQLDRGDAEQQEVGEARRGDEFGRPCGDQRLDRLT